MIDQAFKDIRTILRRSARTALNKKEQEEHTHIKNQFGGEDKK
jgi:hypothetical protein